MIDYSLPYCTYETRHPSGFVYTGKSKTAGVVSGTYRGSGTRFKLALTYPGFEITTWTTTVLATFATEEEAFADEAKRVPLEALRSPWVLNDTEGGARGKYRTRNTIMKQITASKKKAVREKKAAKTRELAKEVKRLQRAPRTKN